MDFVFSFLGGISCKVYDDLYDNKLLKNEILKESLKGSHWILLTLLSHNDFNFSVIALIANALNAIVNYDEWKHAYESSVMLLYPVFLILSFPTRKWLTYMEVFYLLFICGSMIFDPLVITEEYSSRKFIQRSLVFLISICSVFIGVYFGLSMSILKLGMYSTGYFLTSSIFQFYMLSNNDSIPKTNLLPD